jgi:hypothetical protein
VPDRAVTRGHARGLADSARTAFTCTPAFHRPAYRNLPNWLRGWRQRLTGAYDSKASMRRRGRVARVLRRQSAPCVLRSCAVPAPARSCADGILAPCRSRRARSPRSGVLLPERPRFGGNTIRGSNPRSSARKRPSSFDGERAFLISEGIRVAVWVAVARQGRPQRASFMRLLASFIWSAAALV